MAERPFKSLIEARDALTAELLAGKLELSAAQNAVLTKLVENALYKPTHPEDYGFVVTTLPNPTGGDRIPLGVETIAKLTGYKPRAIKTALADLQGMKLIRRIPRPTGYGGRFVDRILVLWAMSEGASAAPCEVPSGPLYGASAAPSDGELGAADAPCTGEEGSREEGNNKGGVTTQIPSQTQNSGQASAPGSLAAEIEALIPEYTRRYPDWTESRIRNEFAHYIKDPTKQLRILRLGTDSAQDA